MSFLASVVKSQLYAGNLQEKTIDIKTLNDCWIIVNKTGHHKFSSYHITEAKVKNLRYITLIVTKILGHGDKDKHM